MDKPLKLVECPRDALQGCPRQIPTGEKAALLTALLRAGFRHLDCASFVSPAAVPQMADSEQLLAAIAALIDPLVNPGLELIGIVLNQRGLQRALATPITTIGFPYSVSPSFQMRNAHQSIAQARQVVHELHAAANDAGRAMVVYLSMAFGNPYGDPYSHALVMEELAWLASEQITEVALSDTAALASDEAPAEVFTKAQQQFPAIELGLHLHSRPEQAHNKIRHAWQAGCRRFDAALTGLGGCPFASDEMVGNIPTEAVLDVLNELAVPHGITELQPALAQVRKIRSQYCI